MITLSASDSRLAAREDIYLAKQDASAKIKFEKELNEESFAKATLIAIRAMNARDIRVGNGQTE